MTNMGFMLYEASGFSQDLSGRNVDLVTSCSNFSTDAGALILPNFTERIP